MANLQIKGIEDSLYAQIKDLAASENRSISQQVVFLIRRYIANKKQFHRAKTPAQVLLELSGSWADSKEPEEIITQIRSTRKNSMKLNEGF
ncbi:MAG: hypothetical protein SVY10_18450 [Thermodesulfobacteriota bacterium]|nr:hypothetical protein [Thermodesulfobacteriota bacterium]